ncbi:hypothetical protein MESS2_860004 [Mesorhizobium metallidurans STM 2683]|uniref:Uncharacterized protein n=1 Tax=Mesorhizobium metallidurans STM 2683 TaxID=1297569 RepID=M5FB22_9HYPH|nr:hypothetical protein MESS2_860004 [Mesorhizobium metallidurans STM 2683]
MEGKRELKFADDIVSALDNSGDRRLPTHGELTSQQRNPQGQ